MAKKTRKVLKQESYQRAIQQSVANVSQTTTVSEAPAEAQPAAAKTTAVRTSGLEITAEQEFAYVRSDVRKSLTLAAIFSIVLVALSFVIQ